jgi:hypothetical protein
MKGALGTTIKRCYGPALTGPLAWPPLVQAAAQPGSRDRVERRTEEVGHGDRRSERQDVPISVLAFGQEKMDAGLKNIDDPRACHRASLSTQWHEFGGQL